MSHAPLLPSFLTASLAAFLAVAACGDDDAPITLQGESPTSTNIPTATDARASGGAYLALDTAEDPPASGWFAAYRVDAPGDGVYRLDAVMTGPAMPDRNPKGGSYVEVSVNGGRFTQIARSEPYWGYRSETPDAWGALLRARLDDIELNSGANEIAFRVVERRTGVEPARYLFSLDSFTLTPTKIALASVHLGDRATSIGVYQDGRDGDDALLTLRLNGRTREARQAEYRVVDYGSRSVATGTVTLPPGADAVSFALPDLPPGNYRVTASLTATPGVQIAGSFAKLPAQAPVRGPANHFSVGLSSPWLLPSSRRDAMASAIADAGAGYVRDEIHWPVVEQERGGYDTRELDRTARVFREHGLKSLGTLWTLMGNTSAPAWAMTPATDPLPVDLRDAYRLLQHLADKPDGVGADALEVWNEPDIDVLSGLDHGEPADAHAAYVKAAALGVADSARRPLVALSGVSGSGVFQETMLQSDIVRYADIWAYHGYGVQETPTDPIYPTAESSVNDFLRRTYRSTAQMWMTEMGVFFLGNEGKPFTFARQVEQAQYLVQSSVTQLATGADKLFWFCAPPYGFAGEFASFGFVSPDFQPWPAYSAYAAMTSILGEARFARGLQGLPPERHVYLFRDGDQAITVVWADEPAAMQVPIAGTLLAAYDIMGAPVALPAVVSGTASMTASPDPIYLVSDGGADLRAKPVGDDERAVVGELSEAEHIVLSQRFAADTTPASPPFGYALGESTPMHLDVYNFNRTAKTVTVAGRTWGGWSIAPAMPQTIAIEPMGRATLDYDVVAGPAVAGMVDYPFVFEATVDGEAVPPSVARVYLTGDALGDEIPLAPAIAVLAPTNGTTVDSSVHLQAHVSDALSGLDPDRITVDVDGASVASAFDPATGLVTAELPLAPGRHVIAVRAWNRAHAPAMVLTAVTAR